MADSIPARCAADRLDKSIVIVIWIWLCGLCKLQPIDYIICFNGFCCRVGNTLLPDEVLRDGERIAEIVDVFIQPLEVVICEARSCKYLV